MTEKRKKCLNLMKFKPLGRDCWEIMCKGHLRTITLNSGFKVVLSHVTVNLQTLTPNR